MNKRKQYMTEFSGFSFLVQITGFSFSVQILDFQIQRSDKIHLNCRQQKYYQHITLHEHRLYWKYFSLHFIYFFLIRIEQWQRAGHWRTDTHIKGPEKWEVRTCNLGQKMSQIFKNLSWYLVDIWSVTIWIMILSQILLKNTSIENRS